MSERSEKLEALFEAAAALETAAQRADYLDRECSDPELRRKVESLLAAHESPDRIFAEPAVRPGMPPSEDIGTVMGRYKLREKLGEGGYGTVWLAEQKEPVRRKVALKVIKLGMDTKQVIARFEAERQALALMDHPSIAQVFDAGTTPQGRPYFVMELVRGIPITKYCDENEMATRDRLELFVKVCHAVLHAHQKGIIHRDLKPSNVLVTLYDGVPVPKVIDFGIAKATQEELTDETIHTRFLQFIGTPAYVSPEQAEMSGLDIDTRSDIYSLGVLLYELLTGLTPFDGEKLFASGLEEMRRILRETEPLRPSTAVESRFQLRVESAKTHEERASLNTQLKLLATVLRGDLDWIVMKCLEKDRTRRYGTATDLAADILCHLHHEPVKARPPSKLYRLQKLAWRNKLAFVAAGAVVLALLLGVAVSGWQAIRATRAERAQRSLREAAVASRQKAEAAEGIARTHAARAEAASIETKRTLAASDFLQAARLIEEGYRGEALAYLIRSLSGNPTNEAPLTRLATLLIDHSWSIPTSILRHDDSVNAAQFSPDGRRIVTASSDRTAQVWDAQTGQPLTAPLLHEAWVLAAHFSPDGKRVVTASGTGNAWSDGTASGDITKISPGAAHVWDAQAGQRLAVPMRHGADVNSAQFSPDGRRIVTAASDKTARVWDAQTGEALTEPLPHGQWVHSAQFSPDGRRIVTAAGDRSGASGTARVWDVASGRLVTGPLPHSGQVNSAEFSPDGQRIVAASSDGTAQVWDAQTGQRLTEALPHKGPVYSAHFSPDGQRIVTASSDRTARIWDARSGRPLTEPLPHQGILRSAHFSPDGKRIVTASFDHTARVWDAQTGEPLTEPLQHTRWVRSAQFSPDGKRIVTASGDGTARAWEAQSGPALTEPLQHTGRVYSAQFSPDGKRILTASTDATARVWDAPTGRPLTGPLPHGAALESAQFSPDGERILTAATDRTARIWDTPTGRPLTEPLYHAGVVHWAQFSPDGKRVVTAASDGVARVWDAQSGQPLMETLPHGRWLRSAQFSPDGMRIVTASGDSTARLWDAQTGRLLTEPLQHSNWLRSAQFSPDGMRIVTASADSTARVWDALTLRPLTGPLKHDGIVRTAQFSPDGKWIATASADHTARVWDARTGQPSAGPLNHDGAVRSAQFSPDARWVVTASEDGTARVWEARTGQPLTEPWQHKAGVWDAQFSPDGRQIVTASEDGTARVWDVVSARPRCPDWLIQLAEAISGQVLNEQGQLEETKLNRAEVVRQVREKLSREPGTDDRVVWGRWFLADPATRTISPYSKLTVPEYIEHRIQENTPASLAEAERLASGNAALVARIARLRAPPAPALPVPPPASETKPKP